MKEEGFADTKGKIFCLIWSSTENIPNVSAIGEQSYTVAVLPGDDSWMRRSRLMRHETTPPHRFGKESTPNNSLISLVALAGGKELSSYGFLFKGASLLANSTKNSSGIYPPVWKRLRNQHWTHSCPRIRQRQRPRQREDSSVGKSVV